MNICQWDSCVQTGHLVCSQSIKTTKRRRFKALFANFSMQQKGIFVWICVNGCNMDRPLHLGVKSAVSWVDSSRWKPSKVSKDAIISRQDFALRILGCARYFFLDYLEKRRTNNSKYYIALLVRLKKEIVKKRPQMKKKKVLFHRDNSHIS